MYCWWNFVSIQASSHNVMLVKPTSFHCSFSVQNSSISSLPFPPTCKFTLPFLWHHFPFLTHFPFWTNFSFLTNFSNFDPFLFADNIFVGGRSPVWAPLLNLLHPFPLWTLQHRIAKPSAVETWSQPVQIWIIWSKRRRLFGNLRGHVKSHTCEKSHKCNL